MTYEPKPPAEQLAWRKRMLAIAKTDNLPKLAKHHEREIRRLEELLKKAPKAAEEA